MSATTCPAYVLTIFYCFPEGEVPLQLKETKTLIVFRLVQMEKGQEVNPITGQGKSQSGYNKQVILMTFYQRLPRQMN